MGMFGLSKSELRDEIAQLKEKLDAQNVEFSVEADKMRAKFHEQESKFKEIGALDHLERISMYQKLELDLDALRRTAASEKVAIENERDSKIRAINADLTARKARTAEEFKRYKDEMDEICAVRREQLHKENSKLAELKKEVIRSEERRVGKECPV